LPRRRRVFQQNPPNAVAHLIGFIAPKAELATLGMLRRKWPRTADNPRANGQAQCHTYALRNRIERCFNKLKNWRRLATRYDKTADSYLGFVLIAAVRLWARAFVNRT